MYIVEILLTGVALSMDAFSVAICKGLNMKRLNYVQALIIAGMFGLFQAVMPLIGYGLVLLFNFSEQFQDFLTRNANLIAFILLMFIGIKMLTDTFKDRNNDAVNRSNKAWADKQVEGKLNIPEILMLALATSLDALMTGFAYACMQVNMILAAIIIGVVTFLLSFVGVFVGHFFGSKWEKPASIVGGAVLMLLGVRFLLTYFGIF